MTSMLKLNPVLAMFSLATLPLAVSCSTQELESPFFQPVNPASDQETVAFALSMAPDADTFEEQQLQAASGGALYRVKVDGGWLLAGSSDDGILVELYRGGGVWGSTGWMPAGSHVVEIVDANGQTALTATIDTQPGRTNHLVLFGRRNALEHRFITSTFDVSPGMLRYTVLNLLRSGEVVDVVRCENPDNDASCATLAGPLAYGEVAQGEAPLPRAVPDRNVPTATAFVGTTTYRVRPAPGGSSGEFQLSRDPISVSPTGPSDGAPIYMGAPVILSQNGGGVALF